MWTFSFAVWSEPFEPLPQYDLAGVGERATGSAGIGSSRWGHRGGEDAEHLWATAGDEERGRGKDGEEEAKG